MNTLTKTLMLLIICTLPCFSDVLWDADFESPDYSLGAVVGQQGWLEYSGAYGSDGQVVNNVPGDIVPQGTQCLHLPPPGVGNYVMVRTKLLTNEFAVVDISNDYVKISYKMRPDSTYDAIDIRTPDGVRMLLMPVYTDGLKIQVPEVSQSIPCTYSNWHDVFIILDPLYNKALQFGLDGTALPVDIGFSTGTAWPAGYIRFSSQVNSPAPMGSGTAQCYFDDIQVTSMPAGPIVGAENPAIFLSEYTSSGEARFANVGRPEEFDYAASTTTSWITIEAGSESGHYSNGTARVLFTADKLTLSPGEHTGSIHVDCGTFGILTFTVTARVGEPSGGLFTLAGIQLMEVNTRENNTKYYQDTMFEDETPHAEFDGGMMDIGVIENFYLFGNDGLADAYISDHLEDPGTAAVVENRGGFSTNTVYELDPGEYTLINRLGNDGSTPTEDTLTEYITEAGLQKQLLNYALHEGVNRFTLITAEAVEFSSQAIIGLYLFASNEVPDFTEGSMPVLAAVDDGSEIIDAAGFDYVGYRSGDVTYFQEIDGYFVNQTLAKTYGSYVIRVTYFNMAGDNDSAVNPYGLTSPGAVGYSCTPPGRWGIEASAPDNMSFLEITIEQAPPDAVPGNTNLFVGVYEDSGAARMYNMGGSNYLYTAYTGTAWLELDPATTNGSVTATEPADILFTVDKTGLPSGYNTGMITVDCGTHGTFYFNVTVRIVEPGVLSVYGLHLTQLSGSGTTKYYQDTMIKNRTPRAFFDGGQMDVAIIRGFYAFGNTFTNDYEAAHLLDAGPAQVNDKGTFTSSHTNIANTVYALDNAVYDIVNPVMDNSANPEIDGELADYISAAALTKEDLAMTLQEGTNQFTFIAGSANEIGDQGMMGLYVIEDGATASFTPGELPTIAAADDDSGLIDAIGFSSCGFVDGDATYFQAATNYFVNGTLKAQVGMYDVTITYFNVAGRNDPVINPSGMSGNGCVGWVTDFNINSQWAIAPEPDQAVGYIELYVEEIPEPCMFGLLAILVAGLITRRF